MKRRAVTLIEIMIVIFIIGLIGSVIGYNMKGSLDEGKAFKSEHGSRQVYDYIQLQLSKVSNIQAILDDTEKALRDTGFVSRPDKLLQDGWGRPYVIEEGKGNEFIVYSEAWHTFLKKKKQMSETALQKEYPWAFYFDGEEE